MTHDRPAPAVPPPATPDLGEAARPQIPLVLSAVFLFYLGQQILTPVIAPLARQCGLAEWQVGATISSAAAMVALTSRFWGHRSQSWGRRPILLAAMAAGTVWMGLFAASARLGADGSLAGTALFLAFFITRGIGFGSAMAMVPPTVQAYVVDATHDEARRVKGIAGIGAMQGLAGILGAAAGGSLSTLGIMAPVVVVPALLALGAALLAARMRHDSPSALVAHPAHVRATDPRVWPYLLAGLGLFAAMGAVQVTMGFIVQDRLRLTAETTGIRTGAVLLLSALGIFVVQSVAIPRCGWPPTRLIRIGALLAAAGCALLVPDGGFALLCAAMLLFGIGLGFAIPGCLAGPTLLVDRAEQGGLAGLLNAANGLTFVVTPVAATALYGVWHLLPIATATVLVAFVAGFVIVHPRFRRTTGRPSPSASS